MSEYDELKTSLFEPVRAFDRALEQQPDLIIPLAVVHLIPIALTLGGGIAIIRVTRNCVPKKSARSS